MPPVAQTPVLRVYVDDQLLGGTVSASWSLDLQNRVSSANVTVRGLSGITIGTIAAAPASTTYWSTVRIDAGPNEAEIHTWFRGFAARVQRSMWPGQQVLVCRGRLYLAQRLTNHSFTDTGLTDNTEPQFGTVFQGYTDVEMIEYGLAHVGLSGAFTPGVSIQGLDRILAVDNYEQFVWLGTQPLLDFIGKIDDICAVQIGGLWYGYRTFETPDEIVRRPMSIRATGTPVKVYMEGVNASAASVEEDPESGKNRVTVQVWDAGLGTGLESTIIFQQPNIYLPATFGIENQDINNPMIQWLNEAERGEPDGMSGEEVGLRALSELCCLFIRATIVTSDGDLVLPGDTVTANFPQSIAVNQNMYVQAVNGQVGNAQFSLSLDLVDALPSLGPITTLHGDGGMAFLFTDIDDSTTTIEVDDATEFSWISPPFYVSVGAGLLVPPDHKGESMLVTDTSASPIWTVERGAGSPAYAWTKGAKILFAEAQTDAIVPYTVASDTTNTIATSLTDGAGGNTVPPSDWNTPDFALDGSWAPAVAADVGTSPTVVAGAAAVSVNVTPALNEQILIRHQFSLPDGVVTSARITISADNYVYGVWLNGAFLYAGSADNTEINVSPGLLATNGVANTIAIWFDTSGGVTPDAGWVSYKLEAS
jgi:hypothetical protein